PDSRCVPGRKAGRHCGLLFGLVATLTPIGGTVARTPTLPVARPHVSATHADVRPLGVSRAASTNWTPQSLASAYGIVWSPALGAGKTIAIIDAYDAPAVEADLATFSRAFGLPACTTANGCFKRVNQVGASAPRPSF